MASESWIPYFHKTRGTVESVLKWKTVDCSIQDFSGKTYFHLSKVRAPETWSQTAIEIAASKYFRRMGLKRNPKKGREGETSIEHLVQRVSKALVGFGVQQKYFKTKSQALVFQNELKKILYTQKASFNSPVWFNCGLFESYGVQSEGHRWAWSFKAKKIQPLNEVFERPQVSACFIQSIHDDLDSIFELVKNESVVFKYGSGSGTNFSALRSKYENLKGGGQSSGVIAFLEVFDRAAGSIKSGGTTRRAAKMVILDVDHPEILEFINWKVKEERKAKLLIQAGLDQHYEGEAYKTVSGQNSNNSVRVTDQFMKTLEKQKNWELKGRTGETLKLLPAQEIWDKIASAAWESADPGLQFHDTINKHHTCPKAGEIKASNPCSEYMFLEDSACNLSSLNLVQFLDEQGQFLLEDFIQAARIMFWSQEMLVDYASYPTEKIASNSQRFRPLGLGFAGFGAFLIRKGIPYDSESARSWGSALTALLTGVAYRTSVELAVLKGPFSGWKENKNSMMVVLKGHQRETKKISKQDLDPGVFSALEATWEQVIVGAQKFGVRNAQATAIAPTGTIGLVMDSETTGVEPEYALVRTKSLAGGGQLKLSSPSVSVGLKKLGYTDLEIERILKEVEIRGSLKDSKNVKHSDQSVFHTALEISPEAHLKMMAAIQPFVSGAISKTINMPEASTVEDIQKMYFQAWKLGLKSIAIYRDRSKGSQPLQGLATQVLADISQNMKCTECGSSTELSGGCFRCLNCGTVVGCG